MFTTKLKYYHGTSQKRWDKISKDKKFVPSHIKKIGDYWITKGAYFVCENPYIALWYAHVAAINDKTEPIVICLEYEIKDEIQNTIVNLLTSDGHKLLAMAHNLFMKKLSLTAVKSAVNENDNLDSYSLELLMSKSTYLKGIIAFFQEGQSFQSMLLEHRYKNRYTPHQQGFSPGDHVEICFYPELEVNPAELSTFTKADLVNELDDECNIWEMVIQGLTSPIENIEFKKKLLNYLYRN